MFNAEPGVTAVQPTAAAQPGMFEGKVRSGMAGMKTLAATANALVLQLGVTFTAGAVDAITSTLAAMPRHSVWAYGHSFLALSWLSPGELCRRTKPIVRF